MYKNVTGNILRGNFFGYGDVVIQPGESVEIPKHIAIALSERCGVGINGKGAILQEVAPQMAVGVDVTPMAKPTLVTPYQDLRSERLIELQSNVILELKDICKTSGILYRGRATKPEIIDLIIEHEYPMIQKA